MADVQETQAGEPEKAIAPAEVLDETINLQEPETEEEVEPAKDEQPGQQEKQEEPEEFDTIEHDGKQYQIPKALKPGFMMHADYTHKTMALADQRREIDAMRERVVEQTRESNEELWLRAELVKNVAILKEYENIDWRQLQASDPVGAPNKWMEYQALERIANLQHAHKEEVAKRFAETEKFAQAKIKGWTPELDKQIIEFAKSKGATDANLLDAMSPLVYELLHLARIGEQTLKAPVATKPQATTTTAKPLSMVGAKGNPSAGKTIADMDMDEYVAFRNRKSA
jgi:hypothetical protein